MIETDVLVVGCGPAGLTAAATVAGYGVRVMAVTRHGQLSPTPRAHRTNQRTFEILRELGIEDDALTLATSYGDMPDELFMRSLKGPEFGRIAGVGMEHAVNSGASPCTIADLPQHLLEPLLFGAATKRGASIRLGTELLTFEQDGDGVAAVLRDRMTEQDVNVRASFMIGADGANSIVARRLALPFEGPGEIGGSVNILFECDLAAHVAHRPGLLYFLVRTAEDEGGAGLAFLRCIKPWRTWLLTKGYTSGSTTPSLSPCEAVGVIRDYLGVGDIDPRIVSIDPWTMNSAYATRYSEGRVFCIGDAVHRHVPSNGLGSNAGIQDAFNLGWKLGHVLQGTAGTGLLESYGAERVPMGRQTVERATASLESYEPILAAIGVLDLEILGRGRDNMAALGGDTPAAAERRTVLRDAIGEKRYEYQSRGLELNQLYRSRAIIDEGQQPEPTTADLDLFYRPTSCPGARLPHAWVQRDGRSLSTLDLAGRNGFTILTGIGGEAWLAAAEHAGACLRAKLVAYRIGVGCEIEDLYGDWATRRGVADDGCLLVRPDGHIAWRRHAVGGAEASILLNEVLAAILDRENASQARRSRATCLTDEGTAQRESWTGREG